MHRKSRRTAEADAPQEKTHRRSLPPSGTLLVFQNGRVPEIELHRRSGRREYVMHRRDWVSVGEYDFESRILSPGKTDFAWQNHQKPCDELGCARVLAFSSRRSQLLAQADA